MSSGDRNGDRGTAIQQSGRERAAKVAKLIEAYRPEMIGSLPDQSQGVRFVNNVQIALRENPKLLLCDPASLFGAIMECAKMGLFPNSALNHCWIIPYGDEAQLQIGYQGLCDLARRSGTIRKIESRAVFGANTIGGDVFDWAYGTEPYIRHKPTGKEDPGSLTHAYAVAWLTSGDTQFDVMDRESIDRIRAMSPSVQRQKVKTPWFTHYVSMAKKTIIKRLCKNLDCSVELRRAIELDEQAEGESAEPQRFRSVIDVPAAGSRSMADAANDLAGTFERSLAAAEDGEDLDAGGGGYEEPSQQVGEGGPKEASKRSQAAAGPQTRAESRPNASKGRSGAEKAVPGARSYPLIPEVEACRLLNDAERAELALLPPDEQKAMLDRLLES